MTQDPNAKARQLTDQISQVTRELFEERLAQALREADQRGYERGVRESAEVIMRGQRHAEESSKLGVLGPALRRENEFLAEQLLRGAEAIRQLLEPEREGKRDAKA